MTEFQQTRLTEHGKKSPYEQWMEKEGVPLHLAYGGTDLAAITDLQPWPRLGGRGAFVINPETWKGMCDAYICEIAARSQLKPQRHLYEETVFVMAGRGATAIWLDERRRQTFEWSAGDYFVIPLNVHFQHFNGGDEPAKILAVTAAPLVINYFHNLDFVFGSDTAFPERFAAEADYFNPAAGKRYPGATYSTVFEANFVQDIVSIPMPEWKERGKGSSNMHFEGGQSSFIAHASEIAPGSYKKAHRHLASGWFGIILRGTGYTLAWKEDAIRYTRASERRKIDWRPSCVLGYPDPWYHQHFNTGSEPARYLAFHFGSQNYPGLVWTDMWKVAASIAEGGDQIEYTDEDPEILRLYMTELERNGLAPSPLEQWYR